MATAGIVLSRVGIGILIGVIVVFAVGSSRTNH